MEGYKGKTQCYQALSQNKGRSPTNVSQHARQMDIRSANNLDNVWPTTCPDTQNGTQYAKCYTKHCTTCNT